MTIKIQFHLDQELHRRARERSMQLGISVAEYICRLLAQDLERPERKADPSSIFNLGNSGGADIKRRKDLMIGQAAITKLRSRRRRRRI